MRTACDEHVPLLPMNPDEETSISLQPAFLSPISPHIANGKRRDCQRWKPRYREGKASLRSRWISSSFTIAFALAFFCASDFSLPSIWNSLVESDRLHIRFFRRSKPGIDRHPTT